MDMLSARAEQAVRDFAASAGLAASPAPDGSFSFRFDGGDVLTFTPATGDRMIVSLGFPAPMLVERDLERVLGLAGLDPATDRALNVGRSRDGSIVLAVAVVSETTDLPTVDAVLTQLKSVRGAVV